ncbi:MAG: hypothetical protein WDZ82_01630 [Candidatus Paceibacterota bacterium]
MYIRTSKHKPIHPYLFVAVLVWAVAITIIMTALYQDAEQAHSHSRMLNPGGVGSDLLQDMSEGDNEPNDSQDIR